MSKGKGKDKKATGSGTIYCMCGGTRGDQQPVVMVAARLQSMGYKIVLGVGPEGKDWADVYGFELLEVQSFEKLAREHDGMLEAAETGDFQTFFTHLGASTTENFNKDLPVLWKRMKDDPDLAGLFVSSTFSSACEPIGRKLGIYTASMYLSPFVITADYPPYFIDRRNPATWQALPGMEDKAEYPEEMNKPLWKSMLEGVAKDFTPVLKAAAEATGAQDLMPKDDAGFAELLMSFMTRAPLGPGVSDRTLDMIYGYSDVIVNGGPSDATPDQKKAQVGYIFDSASTEHEKTMSHFDDELQAFLKAGDAPVYLGWGSMCRKKTDELVRAAVTACKITGKRGIVLYGWAHLELALLDKEKDADLIDYAKDNILFVKHVSHIKLFPECCCIICHGGAGTTAAIVRSGKPCIVTPVWWDQIFFGDRVEAMGLGKRGPHFAKVSGENLAELIKEVTSEASYTEKAKAIRKKVMARKPGDLLAALQVHRGIQKLKPVPLKTPSFSKVDKVNPGSKGLNLVVKVQKVTEVQDGLSEAVCGDDTGIVTFRVRGEQVKVCTPGELLRVQNAKVAMHKGFIRIEVDKWGVMKPATEGSPGGKPEFEVKTSNDVSSVEFELVNE